jgi:hypothetical protein
VAACEVLVATPAVRNLIREAKLHQIPSLMQAGAQAGMQTMDQALANLVRDGLVDPVLAADRSHDRDVLQMLAGPPSTMAMAAPAPPSYAPVPGPAPAPPAPALGGFDRDW